MMIAYLKNKDFPARTKELVIACLQCLIKTIFEVIFGSLLYILKLIMLLGKSLSIGR
jgi:hypothetical protein